MVSEKLLDWLRKHGSRFIVGTPKNQLQKLERQLVQGEWSTVREGLEVQRCGFVPEADVVIVRRSRDRSEKEQAMQQRLATRIETRLTKLAESCRRRRSTVGQIERRVGCLLEKNSRAIL